MSERATHRFQFPAQVIGGAAREEAEYHRTRIAHWRQRQESAVKTVEATISAKLVRVPSTGGEHYQAVVDYGDREAWNEVSLADRKINEHQQALDRYETDARIYGTQGDRVYELDTEDVHHFRLGGQEREI